MTDQKKYLKDHPSGFPYDFVVSTRNAHQGEELLHWQPELEIMLVTKGAAHYQIQHHEFTSQAGDILLIQPTVLHAVTPSSQEEEALVFRIHLDHLGRDHIDDFSQRYLQPLYSGHFEMTPCIREGDDGYSELKSCLTTLFELVENQGLYYDLLLKAKLHKVLYLLFRYRHIYRHYTDDTYQKYQKLKDLIHYLQEHYAETIRIEDLAHQFGYSKNHFMSIFKEHTGRSCMDFLLQLRLNKACDLLTHSRLPISEVASQVGFTNQSNFNRQFKQHYQLTPIQFRKQTKEKAQ